MFLCSGSEAVEYGVRAAESIKPRPLLMTMADSYFGAYGSASRKSEKGWFCFEKGNRIAAFLHRGLERLQSQTGRIEAIRARGLMVAVELKDDAGALFTTRVRKRLVEKGYIAAQRPGLNVLRLDPSLTIEKQAIAGFLDAFEEILNTPETGPGPLQPRLAI